EGTNMDAATRANGCAPQSEEQLAKIATIEMKRHSGTAFVLCSSTNEPRISAIDEVCAKAGRIPCHDLFLTAVRGEAGAHDGCP
ncbi:MAG: hypothetical protein RRY53_05960, partial [Pseudoflavonifractor sp.]